MKTTLGRKTWLRIAPLVSALCLSAVSALAVTVTVNVKDSQNNPIPGAAVKWNDGAWHEMGGTAADGTLTFEITNSSYNSIVVTYHQTSQSRTRAQVEASSNNPHFQTIDAGVRLLDSQGNGLAGGLVQQGGGFWDPPNAAAGEATTLPDGWAAWEVFGGNSAKFKMNYGPTNQTIEKLIPDFVFQTGRLIILSGGPYYSNAGGAWWTVPNASELLPGTYNLYLAKSATIANFFRAVTIVAGQIVTIGAVQNNPPTIVGPTMIEIGCAPTAGLAVEIKGYVTDPDTGQTLTVSLKDGATVLGSSLTVSTPVSAGEVVFNPVLAAPGEHTLTLEVSDGTASASTSVTVKVNADVTPPVIASVSGPIAPVAVNTIATVEVTVSDACGGPVSVGLGWNDPMDATPSLGSTPAGGGTVTGTHVYQKPGVYTVDVVASDSNLNTSTHEYEYVVVYDPNGGFVTGGGWINSPAGASVLYPTATGKATFGFVSKYQRGATIPTGSTEFQFKAGNLNFKSSAYEWLVIAGARAQYKGTGTVNGQGSYRFMLTAIDGNVSGGGGVDRFRIRIWSDADGLIYDNQAEADDNDNPTTALGGGSIVIHNK